MASNREQEQANNEPPPHFVDFATLPSTQEDDEVHTFVLGGEEGGGNTGLSRDEEQQEAAAANGMTGDDASNEIRNSVQQTEAEGDLLTGSESENDGFVHVDVPEQEEGGETNEPENVVIQGDDESRNENQDLSGQDNDDKPNESSSNHEPTSSEVIAGAINEFLVTNHRWKAHCDVLKRETTPTSDDVESTCAQGRPAILEAMLDEKQVELHSLIATERNGQVGTVLGYSVGKDRFAIQMENGITAGIRARNLKVVMDHDDGTSTSETTSSELDINVTEETPLSNGQLVQVLFRPGTLFLGDIFIPGFVGVEGRKEYQLVVDSSHFEDELGDSKRILARHRAYEDEQFVWIQVDRCDDSDTVSIDYADGETQCQGTWNRDKAQFEGTVRQLLPTDDGGSIYHARDEVTHTFTLSPTTALYPRGVAAFLNVQRADDKHELVNWQLDLQSPMTESILQLRHKTDQLSVEILDEFRVLLTEHCMLEDGLVAFIMEEHKRNRQLIGSFAASVEWRELLTIDSLAMEKTCAKFRRWAELLDGLAFESVDHRTNVLAMLTEKKVTRAVAHKESDGRVKTGSIIMQAWQCFAFAGICGVSPSSGDLGRLLVSQKRLASNFERFDGALRRAESRLTNTEIGEWIVPSSCEDDLSLGDGAVCTICHVELQEVEANTEAKLIRLPCSHYFHNDCLREWLRHHTQCPVCRFELRQ